MSRTKTTLFLKKPKQAGRATFALVRREPDGKAKTLKTPAMVALNAAYKSGTLDYNEALEASRRELERVKKTLLVRGKKTTLRPANLRLLDKYWQEVYTHRNLKDKSSAWQRLRRAVEALGDVPLTADQNTLQRQINKHCEGNSGRQRNVVSALRQILKWMGRADIRLSREPKDFPDPRHLSLSEFEIVINHVEDPYRTLFWVLFCTGCRVGEAFALKGAPGKNVWVPDQMRRDGTSDTTKTRKRRRVPVVPEGAEYLKKWLSMPFEDRKVIRNDKIAEIMVAACRKEFPGEPHKHLLCMDLRHCYAIHLIGKGVSLSLVAKALGNSVSVCQEYYVGFTLGDEALETVSNLLG